MIPGDQSTWEIRCLDVEVTSGCNLGCKHCYLGVPTANRMTSATADSVMQYLLRRAAKRQRSELNLYGGEPFLNFGGVQLLVESTKPSGMVHCTIFTNGATATPYQIEWCQDRNVIPKRSTGGCPEAAELTRPGNYTDRWLAEGVLWGDYGDTHRLAVTPATAHLASQGVRWLHGEGYYGQVDLATDDYTEWPTEALEAYEEQLDILADIFVREFLRGNVLGIENFSNFGRCIFGQPGIRVIGCGAGWNTWGITWDGRIVPCHRFFREPPESPLCGGNIRGIISGQKVAFGSILPEKVRSWSRGVTLDQCKECAAEQCCPRGCIHVSQATSGGLDASPEVRCRATRKYASVARWINEKLDGGDWWQRPPTTCQF